jgi:hypothetical protein
LCRSRGRPEAVFRTTGAQSQTVTIRGSFLHEGRHLQSLS